MSPPETVNQADQRIVGRATATVQACRLRSSQDIVCPSHTVTTITWDTVDFAAGGMVPDQGTVTQIEILETGVYRFEPLLALDTWSDFDVVYQAFVAASATKDIQRVHLADMNADAWFDYYLTSGTRVQVVCDNQSGSVRTLSALANGRPTLTLVLKERP